MRFYDVTISATPGGPPVQLRNTAGQPLSTARWTSHPNGILAPPNPAALDCELDLYITAYGLPSGPAGSSGGVAGNSIVRIWGVDLPTLVTAVQFAGNPAGRTPAIVATSDLGGLSGAGRMAKPSPPMFISVSGGFGKGLPLANPAQAGPLTAGQVWQSIGSWTGVDQRIDFILNPSLASFVSPVNLVLNWPQGQPLAPVLKQCLETGFPDAQIRMSISPNLVAPAPISHFCGTLHELALFVQNYTATLLPPGSIGVQLVPLGVVILVYDDTTKPNTRPKQIAFQDLIGQPTWLDTVSLQFMCPMRSDIQVGDTVSMPKQLAENPVLTLQPLNSKPSLRGDDTIQGDFLIISARHTGRFRDPSGKNWSSTFICVTPANVTQEAA